MNIWHDIESSRITPEEFIAVIEISKASKQKYELDKKTGLLRLDRILYTSTHYPAPTTDRDRTVSRRSEPSSRTTLIGGQPNPWDLLQAPGCDEPTSRCQTSPSLWTLGGDQPVIPRVAFIR